MEKSVTQPQRKKISEDLLFHEWCSYVDTFIQIRSDEANNFAQQF